MAGAKSLACTVFSGILVYLLFLPYLFDNGQCDRVCRDVFAQPPGRGYLPGTMATGRAVHGAWLLRDRLAPLIRVAWEISSVLTSSERAMKLILPPNDPGAANENRCHCLSYGGGSGLVDKQELGSVPRLYPEEPVGYPYIFKDARVCGFDGKIYDSAKAAKAASAKVLHCGPHVGACSTPHDVRRYFAFGKEVSPVVGPCVLTYLLLGVKADEECMRQRAQLSEPCGSCWVEDHGCLAAHCYYKCVLKGKAHYKKLIDKLLGEEGGEKIADSDECLECMEKRCSPSFIRSCGTNRRSAGVESEVERDPSHICRSTDDVFA